MYVVPIPWELVLAAALALAAASAAAGPVTSGPYDFVIDVPPIPKKAIVYYLALKTKNNKFIV
jgi:hypothetical protein